MGVGVGVGVGVAVFSWAYVRASGCPGARAHGCVGVCVCFLKKKKNIVFALFCFFLYQEHAAQHSLHLSLHTTSLDVCPMILPECVIVIVIFQSSNLCSVFPQLSTEDTRRNDFETVCIQPQRCPPLSWYKFQRSWSLCRHLASRTRGAQPFGRIFWKGGSRVVSRKSAPQSP